MEQDTTLVDRSVNVICLQMFCSRGFTVSVNDCSFDGLVVAR